MSFVNTTFSNTHSCAGAQTQSWLAPSADQAPSRLPFCHRLVSTCCITLTLTSSVSPHHPDTSLVLFSGSTCFLLPIVHRLHTILVKLLATPCLFPVSDSNVLSWACSSHWKRFGHYQLCLRDHCCNCQVASVWTHFLSVCLWLSSSFPLSEYDRWNMEIGYILVPSLAP